MRRSVYAAWALAFCAASADAFMPAGAPARLGLRAAPAVSAKGAHAAGCACGACGSLLAKRRPAQISMMATGDRGTTTIEQQDSMNGLGMDSETYADSLDKLFPGAVDEASFIEAMSRVVGDKGFNPLSAINLVSTCRDEICRPFTEKLDEKWGEHFSISSLGGMVFCGKTGFGAGMAHSPIVGGKERYVFWVGPHIAFGTAGGVGEIFRPGREKISSACGALIALNGQIAGGKMEMGLNPVDTEMSLLRQAVMSKLTYGQQPNLIGITYAAHDCILDQVKDTAKAAANPSASEYVIISGVQIHGALGHNFWWPGSVTHFANGVETDLSGDYEKAISQYSLSQWVNAKASDHAQQSAGMRLPSLLADAV
jgi:hypothetical protein